MPSSTAARRVAPRAISLLSTVAALGVLSCSGDGPTGPPDAPQVASIQVSPGGDTLVAIGRTRTFVAVARDASGTTIPTAPIRWRSSDTLVARVDSITGVVTAVANGGATITALSGTVTGSGTVSVIQVVAAVQVTPGTSGLATIGATQAFTAVARDSSNAVVAGVRFLWVSSDPSVATVDTLGVARALREGTTTISATGRGVPAYAALTVTQAATQLAFTIEPSTVRAGAAFATALEVEVRDASGALVPSARIPVTISIAVNPFGSTLGGSQTVNSVGGVATFSGLWLDKATSGYRLRATAAGLAPDTSLAFTVRPGLPSSLRLTVETFTPVLEVGATTSTATVDFYDAFGNQADTTYATLLRVASPTSPALHLRYSLPTPTAPHQLRFDSVSVDHPVGSTVLEAVAFPGTINYLIARADPVVARATLGSLSIAGDHTCASGLGGVLCWGKNADAQLGSPRAGPEGDSIAILATAAAGLAQVSARTASTCGLTAAGAVHCWGEEPTGLVPGTGSGTLAFTTITSGIAHTCGLNASGAAFCWGLNTEGQLGNGTQAYAFAPVQVAGSGAGGLVFTAIDAGASYTCGVTTTGAAYCWGANDVGQLGDSTSGAVQPLPTLVYGSGAGDRLFTAISAGLGTRTCGITVAGDVLCWGAGPLGDGTGNPSLVPLLAVAAGGGVTWVDVSVGRDHTCAVRSDGRLECWGYDTSGQMGPDAAQNQLTPIPVSVGGRVVLDVESGVDHTCARTTNGVYCWGSNAFGKLGIGSTAEPVVRTPRRIVQ